jgi:AbrB family looped-hinge helix DNA binding protein
MIEIKTRVGKGGRLVIPAKLRHALGVHVGDEVILQLENGQLRLIPLLQAIALAQAKVRQYVPAGTSLVDTLIQERRTEAERE